MEPQDACIIAEDLEKKSINSGLHPWHPHNFQTHDNGVMLMRARY